jgi:hypothetical protein
MRYSEYRIVTATSSEKLVAEVNKLMKERWQPSGGIVVTRDAVTGIGQSYMQPMVRDPKKHVGFLRRTTAQVPPSSNQTKA